MLVAAVPVLLRLGAECLVVGRLSQVAAQAEVVLGIPMALQQFEALLQDLGYHRPLIQVLLELLAQPHSLKLILEV